MPENSDKSLEFWIWDAASSILCAKDAPKFKEFILPLIFTKRLCDVFDDEINRIAQEVGTRGMANMNVIIHDMEGENQIGDTFRNPKFRQGNRLQTFDRAVANPVWNQTTAPPTATSTPATPTNTARSPRSLRSWRRSRKRLPRRMRC